jgi:2-polyprenyl-3-methyl-5-hydroxy-6-metoxy-1,4-benzoquinol methylase
MKIHNDELTDIVRYIDTHKHLKLEDKESDFNAIFRYIERFKKIDNETKVLEIGTGTGWLPILCKKKGISCTGLEISPQLVKYAHSLGQKYNIKPDIELGNIESVDIGNSKYDIIIATSTFEHVEHWEDGLKKIFDALKDGGLFYFNSTNKFSFISGEYNFPFYGWLPDSWRYKLRIFFQGEDIMKLGIDFNQFTYFQLRKFFTHLGYSTVLDFNDMIDANDLNNPKLWKKIILKLTKNSRIIKNLVLFFSRGTSFVLLK